MYEREKDVNYEVLKGASTDEIVQILEEQVQRQHKGPQCVLCLSSCDPHQPANRLALSESPLCSTLCFGLLFSLQELTARKPPQMKSHNFLQIVPFYQIVFVSSFPRKFEISLIYACARLHANCELFQSPEARHQMCCCFSTKYSPCHFVGRPKKRFHSHFLMPCGSGTEVK